MGAFAAPIVGGLAAGAASGLLGGGSSGGGDQTVIQDLPEWKKPYYTNTGAEFPQQYPVTSPWMGWNTAAGRGDIVGQAPPMYSNNPLLIPGREFVTPGNQYTGYIGNGVNQPTVPQMTQPIPYSPNFQQQYIQWLSSLNPMWTQQNPTMQPNYGTRDLVQGNPNAGSTGSAGSGNVWQGLQQTFQPIFQGTGGTPSTSGGSSPAVNYSPNQGTAPTATWQQIALANAAGNGNFDTPAQAQANAAAQTPQASTSDVAPGLLPTAANYFAQGGPEPYPYYRTPWFNNLETQGQNAFLQGGQQAIADAYNLRPLMGDLYSSALTSLSESMKGGAVPPHSPYTTDAINAAVGRMTDEVLKSKMPQIDSSALGHGQVGSSRQGVLQANALADAQDAAARAAAEQQNADYNSWLNAWGEGQQQLSRAWNLTPTLFNSFESSYMRPSQMTSAYGTGLMGIGGDYRGLQGQIMGDQQALWNETQQRPYQNLDWYAGILNGTPNPMTETTQMPGASPLANIAGLGLAGYGLYQQGAFNGLFGGTPSIGASVSAAYPGSIGAGAGGSIPIF